MSYLGNAPCCAGCASGTGCSNGLGLELPRVIKKTPFNMALLAAAGVLAFAVLQGSRRKK